MHLGIENSSQNSNLFDLKWQQRKNWGQSPFSSPFSVEDTTVLTSGQSVLSSAQTKLCTVLAAGSECNETNQVAWNPHSLVGF